MSGEYAEELRILHVWEDPRLMPEAAIDRQVALQIEAFERWRGRGIRYEHLPACSREQLLQRLNAFRPHVLQISGHGDSDGRILLAHPDAAELSALTKPELATLLRERKELRMLLLDCCYGLVGVDALEGVVDAVVGARGRIQEPYPIAFALSLYDSIASERSLQAAVADAVVAAAERHGEAGEDSSTFELWLAPGTNPGPIFVRPAPPPRDASDPPLRRSKTLAGIALGAAAGLAALIFFALTLATGSRPDGSKRVARETATSRAPGVLVSGGPRAAEPAVPESAPEPLAAPIAPAPRGDELRPDARASPRSVADIASSSAPRGPEFSYEPPRLTLEVAVRAAGQPNWTAMQAGARLSDQDDYVILIRTYARGYLYVYQKDSSGKIEWLYPAHASAAHAQGANPIDLDQTIQLPEAGTFFLDRIPGTEEIVATFSLTRWAELERALGIRAPDIQEDYPRNVGGKRPFQTTTSRSEEPLRFFVDGTPHALEGPRIHRSTKWFLTLGHSFAHVAR